MSANRVSSFQVSFSQKQQNKEEVVQTLVAIAERKPLETNQLLTKIAFLFFLNPNSINGAIFDQTIYR